MEPRVLTEPLVQASEDTDVSKASIAETLAKARQLQARFSKGTAEFTLASEVVETIEADLALYELSEEFADAIVNQMAKVEASGDTDKLKDFFAIGEKVVQALGSDKDLC